MLDVSDPDFVADPHPAYARLRSTDPVHRLTLPDGTQAWLVTRYEDVRAAYTDPRLLMTRPKDTTWQGLSLPPALSVTVASSDPPVHTRLRKLLAAAFTARRVEALRPAIQRFTDELLDAVVDQGECDLMAALARPLPIRVFRELFGLPADDGDEIFKLVGQLFVPNSDDRQGRAAAFAKTFAYLTDLVRRKQSQPGDDLLSALIKARDVDDRLSEDELCGMIAILLVAGSQTTAHLIANSVITMFRRPELAAVLLDKPELVPSAVEEVLRHEAPVPVGVRRFAAEDMVIAGTPIARGEVVMFSIAAANRDGEVFPDPDGFDECRADAGRHMAFGHGIHRCLGAGLAKLEGEVALATILRRLPGLVPATPVDQLRWLDNLSIRGVRELPVAWERVSTGTPVR